MVCVAGVNAKIFRPVVLRMAIYVVHNLMSFQVAAENNLANSSMLAQVPCVGRKRMQRRVHQHISMLV
jgi:hypothetical protein